VRKNRRASRSLKPIEFSVFIIPTIETAEPGADFWKIIFLI
jgi:hypothetical protein